MELGEVAHVSNYGSLFASRVKWRSYDFCKGYRRGTGGSHRGDRADLHRPSGMGEWNGAKTDSSCLGRLGGRLYWRWDFTWPVIAVFLERCTRSGHRNVDSACFILPLVGGVVVFAGGEACGLPIFDRSPTDDLRGNTLAAYRRVDWRNATFPSRFGVDLVGGFVCLFDHHWRCGWIHRLHLVVAPL